MATQYLDSSGEGDTPATQIMIPRHAIFALLGGLLLAATAGCSHLNVRHLERQPWIPNAEQTLALEFWRFSYQPVTTQDSYGIRVQAYPIATALPEWGAHIDELWFAVYLSDSLGRVLAKDVQVLLPRDYTPELINSGIPVEFVISPDDIGQSSQLYVSFGYRMVLTDGSPPPAAGTPPPNKSGEEGPRVFFANEGALSHL